MSDEEIAKAKRALGEPVLAEFSDDLRRTKRNLLIVSCISIFALLSGVQITEAGFLGVKFSNPDQHWLQGGLLAVVGYLFIQFCWRAWDYLIETRLRVTGTRLSYPTAGTLASQHGDYPSNPIQSTLYSWWLSEARMIGNMSATVDEIHRIAGNLEEVANRPGNMDMPNINHVARHSAELNTHAADLGRKIKKVVEVIEAARIPVSLERFDSWFALFPKSQIARLILLDLVLPFVLGAVGIFVSAERLIQSLP